ncbi:MAG: D-sedoheptulose 7-phosphate isomerase [Actinomycetota bacterium]|jgi:D-sedoheptulose 7-phosphate isomerase|nr:D-sedoheptulose 7-phosphate isomerase [Actinomycetota bacterium]
MSSRATVAASLAVKQELWADETLLERCDDVASMMVNAFAGGGKVLFAGNGGSAADAQHLAAELSGRYAFDRPPLHAEALHGNSSYVTAVANDYGYELIYSRLVAACARPGDVLLAFTTSGNSENLLNAAIEARARDVAVVGFTGRGGGKLKDLTNVLINVPSEDTPRIQECHIVLGHAICGLVEAAMFSES